MKRTKIAPHFPMTSFKQIVANRRNERRSTGPTTEEGKQGSRCNAVRRGLTVETVIGALEDAEDYKAFEAAIIADYDAQSALERELVLRERACCVGCAAPRRLTPPIRNPSKQARRLHPAAEEVAYARPGQSPSNDATGESRTERWSKIC
jgi:hypothetical protein